MASFNFVAIDPLALALSDKVYVQINLPYPPPIEVLNAQIRELIQALGPEERRLALERAKAMGAYATALEEALSQG